jgi:uncharacterized protein (DUF2267 family)
MPPALAKFHENGTGKGPGRWRGLCGALLAAVVLAACTTGFVYNRLHWVVAWYVDGLVSLDAQQERQLRDIVDRTLTWHRQTQLPRYVALIEALESDKDSQVTAAMMEGRYQEMVAMLDDFLRQVLPDAAVLLRTLSPEQVDELQHNLEEDNEDLWEEYSGATPEARQKRRARSVLRVLQRFVGRLNSEQREAVESRLVLMHDVAPQWMERRRHWQSRFLAILRQRPRDEGFAEALRDMALNPNQFDPPDYRRRVEENRGITLQMLADLINDLDDRQRGHLGRKFEEYAKDLQAISSGG